MGKSLLAGRLAAAQYALDQAMARIRELESCAALLNERLAAATERGDGFEAWAMQLHRRATAVCD